MSDVEDRDDALEAELRAAFARTRVPPTPPSVRAHVAALATRPASDLNRRSRPSLVLLAAATVLATLIGTAAFVGSRTSPLPSPSAPSVSPSPVVYTPPGTMTLFVSEQPTNGDGWWILGGGPNLPGPPFDGPKVELYTGGGLAKPLDFLGLPTGSGDVDPTRDVIAVADILVGDATDDPVCGRIRLDPVTFDAADRTVTIRYENAIDLPLPSRATPVVCSTVGITARFAVALSIDHLPPHPFSLVLERGTTQIAETTDLSAPATPSPSDDAAVVEATGTFPKGGLWVRQGRTLWTSIDGAISWQQMRLPVDAIDLDVLDPAMVRVVSAGPGSVWPYEGQGEADVLHLVVSGTVDAGRTWQTTAIDGNFGGQQPVLRFSDVSHGYLLSAAYRGGPDTRILVTADGGRTWQEHAAVVELPNVRSVPGFLGAVFTIGPDGALWAGSQGDAGPVARPILDVSRDDGYTWMEAGLPGLAGDSAPPDHVLSPPMFFGSDGVVAVSLSGNTDVARILVTADGGLTWALGAERTGPSDAAAAFTALSRSDWYVATSSGIVVTHDAGQRWQAIAGSGLPNGVIGWLGFADPDRGIAAVQVGDGSPPTRLYATRDGGISWAAVSLDPLPSSAIDPTGQPIWLGPGAIPPQR